MTDAQINPSAKARFQTDDKAIKAHHELIASPAFQYAEDMAVLHYSRSLSDQMETTQNPQVLGMVNAWKLAGVHEFLGQFRNLGEKTLVAQPPGVNRTLNHQA